MVKAFSPYQIAVVVDREFGEHLAMLTPGVPVWVVDTPINKPVAERLWKERREDPSSTGITTFDASEAALAEDMVVSLLSTIELHHGSYSADPPFTAIEIFGASLSSKLRTELSEYGFKEFQIGSASFRAIRPSPAD